jgi:hypothetical protein
MYYVLSLSSSTPPLSPALSPPPLLYLSSFPLPFLFPSHLLSLPSLLIFPHVKVLPQFLCSKPVTKVNLQAYFDTGNPIDTILYQPRAEVFLLVFREIPSLLPLPLFFSISSSPTSPCTLFSPLLLFSPPTHPFFHLTPSPFPLPFPHLLCPLLPPLFPLLSPLDCCNN